MNTSKDIQEPQGNNANRVLATGLSPSKVVRAKYPKAWSQGHPCVNPVIFTIESGADRNPNDVPYRPIGATPHGWTLGTGRTLKEAWKDAAEACR